MKEAIKRFNPSTEFYTPEKCYIIEMSNSDDDPDASIARARVEPGVTTRWHRLVGITERYVILEGSALIEVGNLSTQELSVGDVVLIPPSCRQRITNSGKADLLFLAICTPRFRTEMYEDVDSAAVSDEMRIPAKAVSVPD
jgi:mannose-6-phosphate isomerase-like protein (cupin superfamily)